MNVFIVSTMYPSSAQPVHAVFVEQRVAAIARLANVVVVSPIPWFPFASLFRRYAHRSRIPRREVRGGVNVSYPRFLSVPKFLKPLDGFFLFLACWMEERRLRPQSGFDRIDAHLAYPDGWGALLLGRVIRVPVSVTLRGHDLNDLPRFPIRRRQVASTLRRADAVFAVADALRDAALALGADPAKTRTVGNGVDASRFFPQDRRASRRRLGLSEEGALILSVGHLVERKGFHHLVRAFPRVLEQHPGATLAIVGAPGEEGDFTTEIRRAIEECGLSDHVKMAGSVDHADLAPWYSACDVFVLASEKEGRANVLLEAMACGAPMVATRVWGTPEIVNDPALGILIDEATPDILAGAIHRTLSRSWDRAAISASAGRFSWDAAAREILEAWNTTANGRGQTT